MCGILQYYVVIFVVIVPIMRWEFDDCLHADLNDRSNVIIIIIIRKPYSVLTAKHKKGLVFFGFAFNSP